MKMMSVPLERLQSKARWVAGWTTTALGFTIPIWVIADSILIVLLVVCWLASGEWKERARRITANPVAVSVLLLFGWLLAGSLWGGGALDDRVLAIKKYADLLLIPLLISMAMDAQERSRAILALGASLAVTLVLSLVLGSGVLSNGWVNGCNASNPCVFKKHITHNVLMTFGALLFGILAWRSQSRGVRWGWGLASVLAAGNVLMVHGRTGYVLMAGLTVLALHTVFGWRGMAGAVTILVLLFSGAYQLSTSFHNRVTLTASNVTQGISLGGDVATQERVEFYRHTVKIIQDHPMFGAGTGGFMQAYGVYAKPAGVDVPTHPHNQYLMILAQVGIVGLCLLLWLFVQQWRSICPSADVGRRLLTKGLVLIMVVGCLFNDLLIDHTEKLLYCWFSGLMYSETDSDVKTT
ncbi:MAG: O-antigen ligase family protein [Nitrospira sp.]|nr:O-antigen ligase family protein [Nitrospira sp.]